jgi:Protein of unknown function DUF262
MKKEDINNQEELNQEEAENLEDAVNQEQEQENVKEEPKKIERTTAIEKVHIPKTIKSLARNKSQLRFDLAIQRNNVWSLEQKSLFIHSLIYGFPFPPAYAQDKGDGQLWMLDGKQRLSTVISFLEDGFKLHKATPNVFGVAIANLKFSQLPEQFQDEIKDTNFTIYQMRNMTDEERDEMFVRLNKGTPLSKIEQTRAMYSDLIEQVESIASLEFFADHVSIPKNRFADQELIIQTAMILDTEHNLKGTGSTQIQKYVAELKEKGELLSEDVYDKFVKADDYLSMAVSEFSKPELKQVLKKVNVPMVIVTSLRAIEEKVDSSVFGDFLVDFLITNYSKETPYGLAVQNGSAKKESVLTRLTEMDKAYTEFVNNRLNLKDEEKIEPNTKKLEEAI